MSPRPTKAAERRPQTLSAAARTIVRRGVTGLRLADVAAEAGVSIGTIQHYFGTRERLLTDTFVWESEQAVGRWLGAHAEGGDAFDRIVALVDTVLEESTFRERWTRWLQFSAAYARDPKLRRVMGTAYARWQQPFRQVIEEGVASGSFRPALPLETVVDRAVALFDGLALQVLLDAPGMTLGRMRELLLAGLAADLGVGGGDGDGRVGDGSLRRRGGTATVAAQRARRGA